MTQPIQPPEPTAQALSPVQSVVGLNQENGEEAALKELPVEAARAHLRNWWREPLAGLLSFTVGVIDCWHFGKDAGITSSLDEIMIITGIVLIAGSRRLFGGLPTTIEPPSKERPK